MDHSQENGVQKSFRDWLSEGERLYNTALSEYQGLEAQIDDWPRKSRRSIRSRT
jgi:hypothetical protein